MYSSMRLKIECSLGGNLNFSSCGVWMVIWPHQAQLWISTSAPGDTCTILFRCKNMPKRGFQTILVYMLPWSTLRGLSFSQFDQRTHRFNLQSIEVSYCDWGAAKRLMPSCSSLSALTTRTGAPDRRPSGPSFRPETGTPKIPEFILFSGWRVFLPKFFDKKAITVLPDPHMKHSLESGPLLGLWKYLPWPSNSAADKNCLPRFRLHRPQPKGLDCGIHLKWNSHARHHSPVASSNSGFNLFSCWSLEFECYP